MIPVIDCRYRSITKQFFRKADGVVVMYDVTVEESFKAVQPWLTNVQVGPSSTATLGEELPSWFTNHPGINQSFD